MESLLKNTELEVLLLQNGFVKAPAISSEVVNALQQLYSQLKPNDSTQDFFTTTLSLDNDYRKKVNKGIVEVMQPELDTIFCNYQAVNANFMVKPSGSENTTCQLHQDWTYVDEEKYLALNIWVPLVDLNIENGAMHFIRGSHLFDKRVRGRNIYWPYFDRQDHLISNMSEPVVLQKGEPVIFIGKTFHYSPPNTSGTERVGASIVITHQNAQLMNYYQQNGIIYKANVEAPFFTEHGVNSKTFRQNLNPEFFAFEDYYNCTAVNKELLH